MFVDLPLDLFMIVRRGNGVWTRWTGSALVLWYTGALEYSGWCYWLHSFRNEQMTTLFPYILPLKSMKTNEKKLKP
jgi:hypothetical protein